MRRKVGIIGAGFVGATTAYTLAINGICSEIVLYDIVTDVAIGKAIDIAQSLNFSSKGVVVTGAKDATMLQDCDIVVVTAGVPRKDGMTREDLLHINATIMKDVISNIKKYSPDATIMVVSNPLDVMTYFALKETGWSRNRVFGMAGALDSSRMAYEIGNKLGFGIGQIKAIVIGDHGENMIPCPELSTVNGIAIDKLLNKDEIEDIIKNTKKGGATIVKHLKTSAYYAPARAISAMVEAVLDDSKKVFSTSVLLEGEYGYENVTVGVPAIIGKNGVEKIIEIDLNDEYKEKLQKSINTIKESISML
jgi:malate dehydrogenase